VVLCAWCEGRCLTGRSINTVICCIYLVLILLHCLGICVLNRYTHMTNRYVLHVLTSAFNAVCHVSIQNLALVLEVRWFTYVRNSGPFLVSRWSVAVCDLS
jgi:hypothetical protein